MTTNIKSVRKGIRRCIYLDKKLDDEMSRFAILDKRSFSEIVRTLCGYGLKEYKRINELD